MILVTSNNGRVHLTERSTKQAKKNTPKEYFGFVRKLCDGQWVSDKKQVDGEITCPVCKKL